MTLTAARQTLLHAIEHLADEPDDDATLHAIALLTRALGGL